MDSQQKTQTSKCIECNNTFEAKKAKMFCSKRCATNSFRKKRRDMVNNIKLKKGCELCGYNKHAAALHFDHLDTTTKSFNISQDVKKKWTDIEEEISKCRVLCANCHSVHTYEQDHYNVRK